MAIQVTAEPIVDPIDVIGMERAKTHLRVDGTQDDDFIRHLAAAAFDQIEVITGRALITQTLTLYAWRFLPVFYLPRGRVQSVESVQYVDSAGAVQSLSSGSEYVAYSTLDPCEVRPAFGTSWPGARSVPDAVRITWIAGYGIEDRDFPAAILQAALLLIGDLFENRESGRIGVRHNVAVNAILAPLSIRDERVTEVI